MNESFVYTKDTEKTLPLDLSSLKPKQESKLCSGIFQQFKKLEQERSVRQEEWKAMEELLFLSDKRKPQRSVAPELTPGYRADESTVTYSNKNMDDTEGKNQTVEDRDNTTQGIAYASKETLKSSLMTTIFPTGQEYLYLQSFDGVTASQTQALQKLLRDHLKLINFKQGVDDIFEDQLTYGIAFVCYEWVKESKVFWKKTNKQEIVSQGSPKTVYEKLLKTTYNGCKISTISPHSIVYDTQHTDPNEAMVIRRKYMTGLDIVSNLNYSKRAEYEEIQQGYPKDLIHEAESTYIKEGLNLYTMMANQPEAYKQVEVYEAWGDFVVDGKLVRNYVLEFAVDALKKKEEKTDTKQFHVLRFEPNPYQSTRPYVISKCGKGSYPKSPIELSLCHYRAMANSQQAIKDVASTAGLRPWLADTTILTKESVERLQNSAITKDTILFTEPNNDKPPERALSRVQDTLAFQLQPLIGFMDMLKGQAQGITGETQSMGGGQAPQYMKTGVALAFQEGSMTRIAQIASRFETTVCVPIFKKTMEYLQQYSQVGEQVITSIGRRNIKESVDFDGMEAMISIRGSSFSATKQLETNNLIQAMQMLLSTPAAAIVGDGGIIRLIKQLLSKLNVSEVDDIIPEGYLQETTHQPLSLWDRIKGRFYMQPKQPPGNSGGSPNAPLTDINTQGTLQ